ncbi:hypothetical protein BaRGS_00021025 [Batillaria attramentaria]|uniref:Uncharacterized protein n=1 Tax=Batillaria attramentaria TaxID=370345 RepID=A0ABD0KL49_9CAEN
MSIPANETTEIPFKVLKKATTQNKRQQHEQNCFVPRGEALKYPAHTPSQPRPNYVLQAPLERSHTTFINLFNLHNHFTEGLIGMPDGAGVDISCSVLNAARSFYLRLECGPPPCLVVGIMETLSLSFVVSTTVSAVPILFGLSGVSDFLQSTRPAATYLLE